MDKPLSYPLAQLMLIKQNRFDQAVKTLEQKKGLLAKAEEKLYSVQKERDAVLEHKVAKLSQLRNALDEGTTTDKIQQMKSYLKVVDGRLAEKEKAVKKEQTQVDLAKKQVEVATAEMFQKKKDLEKIQMHKQEWEKEVLYWTTQKEGVEQDEQGSATHIMKKQKHERE